MDKDKIKAELKKLEDARDDLEDAETSDAYEEFLDETKKEWIDRYDGATALKELDPIAFRVGFSDFNDEELTNIQSDIDELRSKLEKLGD